MYSPGKREETGRLVEAISIIQDMTEDGLDQNGSYSTGKKWLDSGYILKIKINKDYCCTGYVV